jgi:peroxiredoxin
MTRLNIGDLAPDFSLPDHSGRIFTLSDVLKTSNALLVFNIGFA